MEIASKGAKIRYVFSHFLRRALPPVHIAQCMITSSTSCQKIQQYQVSRDFK